MLFFMSFILFYQVGQAADSLEIEAESAILVDGNSGTILYEKNADERLSPASMTKMMTEYLILEAITNGDITWDQHVPISDYAYTISQKYPELSNVPLLKEETYTVEELYKAMAIYSANGATIALTELVSGSEKAFVEEMNAKARDFGLSEYEFFNSTGLNNRDLDGQHPAGGPEDENILSARATALLAFRLIHDYPEVHDIASIPIDEFTAGVDEPIEMINWNWMLPGLDLEYEGIDGLKTGSTALAGNSFTASAKRNDVRLISVVMKTESRIARFRETEKLLDWGFSQFSYEEIVPKGFQIENESVLAVDKGKEKSVEVEAANRLNILVKNGEKELYEPVYQWDDEKVVNGRLVAPVEEGEKVGVVSITYNGDNDYQSITGESQPSTDLITTEAVERANWFSLGMRAVGNFFSGLWSKVTDSVKGIF